MLGAMRTYALVGCGHCGAGVVPSLASICPFRQEPVCETCHAEVMRFVTAMQAKGNDPLPKLRRETKRRQSSTPRKMML